jgi:hypothetical protein
MKPETDNLITGSGPPNAPAQCKAERTKLNMPRTSPIPTETAQAYATSTDFCRVFVENTDSMHLLSFLLTADQAKAEECFVSGLEGCVKGNHVFRDWASSWARRTIILKAVRMLAPGRDHDTAAPVPGDPVNCKFGRTPQADAAIASILGLGDFERFVFVMSVLERYSDQDCSVLLGCSRQDVREARIRALQHVAESDRMRAPLRSYHSETLVAHSS